MYSLILYRIRRSTPNPPTELTSPTHNLDQGSRMKEDVRELAFFLWLEHPSYLSASSTKSNSIKILKLTYWPRQARKSQAAIKIFFHLVLSTFFRQCFLETRIPKILVFVAHLSAFRPTYQLLSEWLPHQGRKRSSLLSNPPTFRACKPTLYSRVWIMSGLQCNSSWNPRKFK